jgi:heat shock protein HslJ
MKNIQVLPVIVAGILILACKTAPDASAESPVSGPRFSDLIGKEWKLTEIRSSADTVASRFSRQELTEIGMENAYTLRFEEERLGGMGAPNRYFAPYEQGEGQALSIRAIAGTLMASFREPENLKEKEYFKYLENVEKWDLVQGKLQLYTKNEQGEEITLIFETE